MGYPERFKGIKKNIIIKIKIERVGAMKKIDQNIGNHFCLKKQHLTDDTKINDIVKIADDIGGLHATSSATTYLSLFIRAKKFHKEDLEKELYIKRNLGKIRYVRGTMYVLPKKMIPAAFSGQRSIRQPRLEKYFEFHKIKPKEYKIISKQILGVLKGKNMTVQEIKTEIGTESKISQVLNLMCDEGQLIRGKPRGGWKSNLHTYHRMDECFPDLDLFKVKEFDAKKQIILQYLKSFGPVTINDAAWWTKYTKTEIKSIIHDHGNKITQVKVSQNSEPHYILTSQKKTLQSMRLIKKSIVCLLPTLDPYIMGYKDRDRYLDMDFFNYIFDRSGNGSASILVDGKIIGVWDVEEKTKAKIKIYLFSKVNSDIKKKIHSKAKNIGMFITGKKVQIKERPEMVPLSQRTAGSVMSPLKDC